MLALVKIPDLGWLSTWRGVFPLAIWALFFSWPAMFLVALPMHWILCWIRMAYLPCYMIGFAWLATKVLPFYFLLSGPPGREPPEFPGGFHVLLKAAGAAGGAFFWLLRRPDRDRVSLAEEGDAR